RWVRGGGAAQSSRADGPPQHQAKYGTPTMGGIIIYFTMLLAALFWARLEDRFVMLFMATSTVLWIIGFFDDYYKSRHPRKKGISANVKMAGQLVLAFFVVGYLYHAPPNAQFATQISVPYSKEWTLNLGALYVPFAMLS